MSSDKINEITKSLVIQVALNKQTPVIEKVCQLLVVFGSGRQGVNGGLFVCLGKEEGIWILKLIHKTAPLSYS